MGLHTFLVEKGVLHIWRLDGNAHDTAVVASISIPNCPDQLFDDAGSSSIIAAINCPLTMWRNVPPRATTT